jgi:hypothetical protein
MIRLINVIKDIFHSSSGVEKRVVWIELLAYEVTLIGLKFNAAKLLISSLLYSLASFETSIFDRVKKSCFLLASPRIPSLRSLHRGASDLPICFIDRASMALVCMHIRACFFSTQMHCDLSSFILHVLNSFMGSFIFILFSTKIIINP